MHGTEFGATSYGNARAKLYFLKADGSSWSLASLKAREHIKADGQ